MPLLFQFLISLIGSFVVPMVQIIIFCVALALLCSCPYIVRRVIDYV